VAGRALYSHQLARVHFLLQSLTIFIAVSGFCMGFFSGREYLEFPPWLSSLIIIYWVLFAINFLMTIRPRLASAPVYIWSWCTGLLFFFITMIEAHLWLLPYFNDNIIRDLTVQWKANGSMVGAWNMLIYGTAMYAMEQITGDRKMGHQKISFAFYFLGLTNLMFNWGHHTYIVPANPIVKQVAYIISMTELVLLANILWQWKNSYKKSGNTGYPLAYRFFKVADTWILLNLILAIAISVPYINQYTHGTQITVAHAMGATIGINTMLLLASVTFIFEKQLHDRARKTIGIGLTVMHYSLLFFWISLLGAGIARAIALHEGNYFAQVSRKIMPYLAGFSASGVVLMVGICLIAFSFIKTISEKQLED
jgi:nitric oxide reductase subunit B